METVVDIVGGEEVKKLESADPVVYQLVRVHLYALVLDNVNGRSFIFFFYCIMVRTYRAFLLFMFLIVVHLVSCGQKLLRNKILEHDQTLISNTLQASALRLFRRSWST